MSTKRAGFAFRGKSNKIRDQEEPEIVEVFWNVSAQHKSQEHSNQIQQVWVRIQKQDNSPGKVKDITNPNGDQKNRWGQIQLHVKTFKFGCLHVKQVSKLPMQHQEITSAEGSAANPQEGSCRLPR